MRVAVVGPNWNPLVEPFAGGQESLVAALISGLRDRGHHVEAYAAAGTPDDLADRVFTYPRPGALSATAQGDPQLPEPGFLVDQVAFTAAVADLATRHVDVVLNHSLHYLVPSLAGLLPATVVPTLQTPPFRCLEVGAGLAPVGARFVAVSGHLARQWTTISDIDVIPNGVDPRRFPVGAGGDDLVWVGRIVPEKGLHVAVEAARLAGRRLHVVGPVADRAYAATCLERAGADVVHHGHLDHEAVAELVGRCAANLVTPRWDEPFGLVAAEAMMCATPVVALDRGGLADVVGDDGGVLVVDDPDDDVAARRLAAAVDAAAATSRTQVRAAAVRRLSVGTMLDGYERLMRDVRAAPVGPSTSRPPS